jgi:hypothetical protein
MSDNLMWHASAVWREASWLQVYVALRIKTKS